MNTNIITINNEVPDQKTVFTLKDKDVAINTNNKKVIISHVKNTLASIYVIEDVPTAAHRIQSSRV